MTVPVSPDNGFLPPGFSLSLYLFRPSTARGGDPADVDKALDRPYNICNCSVCAVSCFSVYPANCRTGGLPVAVPVLLRAEWYAPFFSGSREKETRQMRCPMTAAA